MTKFIGSPIKQTFSVEERNAYALSIGLTLDDAEAWWDHNETVGWIVGKTRLPMKNWQASLRTWKRNKVIFENRGNAEPVAIASTKSKKMWTCKYCNQTMPFDEQYGHAGIKCSAYIAPTQEVFDQIRSQISYEDKTFSGK